MKYMDTDGVVLHDANTDQLLTEPTTFLVLTKDGWREMRLRVGRGTIRDVPVKGTHGEAHD